MPTPLGRSLRERTSFWLSQARSTRPTAAGRVIMSQRIVTVAAFVLVAGIGGYAVFLARAPGDSHRLSSRDRPVFTEGAWPFPIDQWGEGWAFQCKAADCGIDVSLY